MHAFRHLYELGKLVGVILLNIYVGVHKLYLLLN